MRILVIEDEPDIRVLIRQILEEAGYSVDAVEEGTDGLLKATSQPYDAVVLDLRLPGLDGWGVLEQLRKTHTTPVLILSARQTLSDRVSGLELGADDYLVKPFERLELLARLRALIRRSVGQAKGVITLEDLTIDLNARCVRRAEEELGLTPREFALLEYLVLHRGRVVSRSEIFDRLLQDSADGASTSLDVHVSNLRKKLGSNVIETRRGKGYVIAD